MAKYPVDAQCAETLKALSEVLRLRMVVGLLKKEKCVGDIARELGISQPHASHHLRILRNTGIVETYRKGHKVYYLLTSSMRSKISPHDRTIHLKCCSIKFRG